jgi:pimeloyl-ACP methyl ester carboxylesterase
MIKWCRRVSGTAVKESSFVMEPVESLSIDVAGHRHGALAAGPVDGPLVLLLHGWPEFADSWTQVLAGLGAAGYRAVAVDQRGYAPGARPAAVADYAINHLVDDALAFADSQGGGRFHLVAHDWGGMVAWVLAGAHPDRLRTLSVLATPHPSAFKQAAAAEYHRLDYVRLFRQDGHLAEGALRADGAARLRAAYGGRVPGELVERNVARLSEPGALTGTLNWYRGATDDEFSFPVGTITVPTLYVWGDQDSAFGRGAAQATGDFVTADYRFEILDGVSHWIPEEAPDRVTPMIIEHLRAERP